MLRACANEGCLGTLARALLNPAREETGSTLTCLSSAPGAIRRRLWALLHGELALAAGVSLVAVLPLVAFADLKTRGTAAFADPGWDRHLYVYMAEHNPLDFHLAPFNWRVLVPLLAKAQPFSLQTGFLVISLAASWATGVALFHLLRKAGFARSEGIAGVLFFFSLGWGPKFVLSDFWIPDAAAFFFSTLAVVFALGRRLDPPYHPATRHRRDSYPGLLRALRALRGEIRLRWPLALTLAVGVATKESVLFAGVLCYTLNASRTVDRKLLAETAAVMLPAVIVVIAIRTLIPAYNGDDAYLQTLPDGIRRFPELFPDYNYLSLAHDIGYEQRLQHFDGAALRSYTVDAFGLALPLLALIALPRHWRLALRLAPFVALVYAQLAFATDTERLLVAAFPPIIWLAVKGGRDLCNRAGLSPLALPALAAAMFALVLADRSSYDVAVLPQVAVLAAFAVAAAVASRLKPSREPQ